MSKKIDRFGNIILDLTKYSIRRVITKLDKFIPNGFEKAILIKNAHPKIIKKYNRMPSGVSTATLQYHCHKTNANAYLIRNNSRCPELVNNKISAAGCCGIYWLNSEFYVLMANDKTKKYLSVPGGTASTLDGPNKMTVALRELNEETKGTTVVSVNNGFTHNWVDGMVAHDILISPKPILKFNFNSKFFDIDVNDEYAMYYYQKEKQTNDFEKLLFAKHNLVVDNSVKYYKLKYLDNSEISNILAIKLTDTYQLDKFDLFTNNVCEEIIEPITKTNLYQIHNHPVTYLHIYMSLVGLLKYCYPNNCSWSDLYQNKNFPSNLKKYQIF